MKKIYSNPVAEKLDFSYSNNVTASDGYQYRKYIDNYVGCKETPTDEWFDNIFK